MLIHGIGHRRRRGTRSWTCSPSGTTSSRLDLAGFGESPAYAAGTPYTMDNACADLAANFAEWGLERPHVVGNSLGGAISLELAARGLVSSATVLSPAGFFGRFERLWPLTALSLMRLASKLPDACSGPVARSRAGRRMVGYLLYTHPERASAESTYADSRGPEARDGVLPDDPGRAALRARPERHRRPRHRRLGHPGPAAALPPVAGGRASTCRRPGTCRCPTAATCR